MSVLSQSEIRRRLALPPPDPESLVITPILDRENALSEKDAVDLRLGCYFLLPRLSLSRNAHFCPDSTSPQSLYMRLHVPLGRYLVVPAHQTVLGATLEFIKLPYDVSGEILTKSSVARTFTLIETAPWVHPSYRGCLTLEIANVSNTPLLLYPGRAIGQLVLLNVEPKPEKPKMGREQLSGKYLGPVYPEPPKFDNPEDDLRKIGILKTLIIPPASFGKE